MFDVGFGEFLLLLVLAVLVFGPQRIPELLRGGLRLKHRLQQHYWQAQEKIQREFQLDELRQELAQQDMQRYLEQLNREVMDGSREMEDTWTQMKRDLDRPPAALQNQPDPTAEAETGEEPRRDRAEALPGENKTA